MRHKRTDPACSRFAGIGKVWTVLGSRVRSPRRVRFDRGRGRSCEACHYDRLRRADDDRQWAFLSGAAAAAGIRLEGD